MNCPCRERQDRHTACHDVCARYAAWRAWKDAGKLARRAQKDAEQPQVIAFCRRRRKWLMYQKKEGK